MAQVFVHFGDGGDAKGIYEDVGNVRRQERRECRPQVDVLDTQVKECKEDDDGLLLVPCDVVSDREIVEVFETEGFLESKGYLHERVAVVALTCIEDTWDTVDVAEREFVVAVLSTTRSEDDGVVWKLFGKLSVVVTSLHTTVTTTHDKELADSSTLDSLDDLIGKGNDLIVRKPTNDLACLYFLWRETLLGMLDESREVLGLSVFAIFDVLETFET